MRYCEYAPDPRLAAIVRCYWVFEAAHAHAADAPDERIVPDGCAELIFHYGDAFAVVTDAGGRVQPQPRHLLAGQLTRPLFLRAGPRAGLISVRFTPWGARRLFRFPMTGITDDFAAVDALGERWLDRIDGEIDGCIGDAARIAMIERAFMARLGSSSAPRADPLVASCAGLVLSSNGRVGVGELSLRTGLGARQLERRFNAAIGMPPKTFASIVRFRSLFDAMTSDSPPDWLSTALDAGYFDQPHMIRDFRRYAGVAPRAFVESLPAFSRAVAGQMSGSYKTRAASAA